MATAKISMPGGISVEIDGTPDEVTAVVQSLRRQHLEGHSSTPGRAAAGRKKGKVEIRDLVDGLKAEEFFTTPRGLGEIQKKFGEMGHHYPVTTLSGAMQTQAQSRNLRRFKQNGKYVYVQ
jgi:site-specific DNA-cytosine methylase